MASHLSPLVAVLVVLVTVGLIWLNRGRDALSILQTRFRASHTPEGPLVECEVRFPLTEMPTPCVAHASEAGLYLFSTKEMVTKWRWTRNIPFIKQQVWIPWSELDYRRAGFPMENWLRFDIRNTKGTFFIKQAVALELLRAAGQPLSKVE